jgi:hypothetical protein
MQFSLPFLLIGNEYVSTIGDCERKIIPLLVGKKEENLVK